VLAIAALVALPAAAQARVVETVSVAQRADVPAGQSRSVTLKCPAHAVALNGSAFDATSSIPGSNARRWSFLFSAGARAESARAVLRCVRLRLPRRVRGVGLAVGTVIEPVYEIPPGNTQNIDMSCPSGQVPTGFGLERAGADNGLSIAKANPTKKGWSFAVENAGAVGAAGRLHIRCLEPKQRATSGQRHAFATRVASFTEQLEGSGTAIRACRAGEYSVATGVSLPPADDIVLAKTGVVGERGGEWSFAQGSGATSVETSIVCLARTTGFHR
jgi:hypothetical protein